MIGRAESRRPITRTANFVSAVPGARKRSGVLPRPRVRAGECGRALAASPRHLDCRVGCWGSAEAAAQYQPVAAEWDQAVQGVP
ncbi:hypothetical protein GCM10022221_08440 [Actinocorallia aurea]